MPSTFVAPPPVVGAALPIEDTTLSPAATANGKVARRAASCLKPVTRLS